MATNNADYGISLQSIICDEYGLVVNNTAKAHFIANYNSAYEKELVTLSHKIFKKIGLKPQKLLTYTKEMITGRQTTSPHNFLLENGETLSIRTTKGGTKVAPRSIGQAGFEVLNDYFAVINNKEVRSQEGVREMVYNHIHEMLPIFIDCLFLSDYTVLIDHLNQDQFEIIRSRDLGQFSFDREEFSFTRGLSNWIESTTLKYHNKSIAEIQTHKERTFKFRFIISAIPEWIKLINENNETFGISAEAAICDLFSIKKPESFLTRASKKIAADLMPVVEEAFNNLPKAIYHTGSDIGERGGQSKCSYDFLLEGNKTLSLKTNKGKMVCPPEVGQPGAETCYKYFKEFLPEEEFLVNNDSFKKMVYEHIEDMIPIYVNHMFDSDCLLWIYSVGNKYKFKIIYKDDIKTFHWQKEKFSFTKADISLWNESNTVKYDGVTIGEFQVHNHRSCFKFRFHLANLLTILEK